MKMPFGKWRDYDLEVIPSDYLEWILKNVDDLHPPLRRALEHELDLRSSHTSSSSSTSYEWQRSQKESEQQIEIARLRDQICRLEKELREAKNQSFYSRGFFRIPDFLTIDGVMRIISAGRQNLALKLHGDLTGGSDAAMKQVNIEADWLESHMREIIRR